MDKHVRHHEHSHAEHKEHSHDSKTKHEYIKLKKRSIWQITSAILALLLVISIFTSGFGLGKGGDKIAGMIAADAAADKAINFISDNLLTGGQIITLKSVEDEKQLYKITIEVGGQEFVSYVSKDGKLLFPSAIDIDEMPKAAQQQPSQQPSLSQVSNAPKKEKAEADLFVMTYCPFGTQAQNAMIPVMELLGDKADINIRFVNYIMQDKKEIDENTVQYCIQKGQRAKMIGYLKCFLESKNSKSCIEEIGVDKGKLDSCIIEADKQFNIEADYADKGSWGSGRYPRYRVDDELNDKYGVESSPTLIINGVKYSGSRSPEGFKQAICAGFDEPPKECDTVLSGAGAAASGSC